MSQDSSLNLAIKYLQQKQYQKAENILQNLLKTIPFEEKIVLYLGFSLIEQQKYEEALNIYRKYLSINSDQYKLLRAFCYAKMGFLEKALNDWIKLSKEGNKIAISILSELKKTKDNKTFITFLRYNRACGSLLFNNKKIKKRRFNSISENFSVNSLINFFKKRKLKLIIVVSIFVILIFSVYIYDIMKFSNSQNKNSSSLSIDVINNQTHSSVTITTAYIYKDNKQIEKDLNLAKKYISQTDYNNSRLILNKIIYSNAEEKYKEKSRNLEHLLVEPFFNKLTYNPTFNEVIQNPLVYLNIFIQWKAIVYELLDNKIFSIMVYSKNPIYIDGISYCVLPREFPLFVKQQVEIFGKIIDIIDNKIPKIEIKNIRIIYE